MNEEYDINFEERSARQSTIFGIIVGIIAVILYSQEVLQRSNIRGDEWIYPLLIGGLYGLIGFFSGLTYYKSRNPYGLFPPFIALLVHYIIFGGKQGDDLDEFFMQCLYAIFSLGITFILFFIMGFLSNWVKRGR